MLNGTRSMTGGDVQMIFKPHEYQKYCISRCITDDKLGLFLDMGLRLIKRKNNYNTNSNKRFEI